MGEKDITEKILEDHNDVFADIINGLIFAGEQRILPESLENTAVHSQYKADDEKVHELERDVAKYWKDQDVQLAILIRSILLPADRHGMWVWQHSMYLKIWRIFR